MIHFDPALGTREMLNECVIACRFQIGGSKSRGRWEDPWLTAGLTALVGHTSHSQFTLPMSILSFPHPHTPFGDLG